MSWQFVEFGGLTFGHVVEFSWTLSSRGWPYYSYLHLPTATYVFGQFFSFAVMAPIKHPWCEVRLRSGDKDLICGQLPGFCPDKVVRHGRLAKLFRWVSTYTDPIAWDPSELNNVAISRDVHLWRLVKPELSAIYNSGMVFNPTRELLRKS
jgi:hypothetical protein